MKKLHIIILAAAGIISFAGAFGVTSIFKSRQTETLGSEGDNETTQTETAENSIVKMPTEHIFAGTGDKLQGKMLEDQLRNLIFDVRETIKEQKVREKDIASQEERIASSRKTAQEDIERLSKLNDQLKITIADLKNREESLKATIREIKAVERENLVRLAATYDKMDSASASKIMINMASNQQLDDAVKIIYLMTERTAAKLLSEISTAKPELACLLSTELKKVKESE